LGCTVFVLLAVKGVEDLPAEDGVLLDGCGIGKGPAMNNGVGVHVASGRANASEGGEVVSLVIVVLKVLGVLNLLLTGDGEVFEGAPGGRVAGLANNAVLDSDVC
jgi:hypothetical protein